MAGERKIVADNLKRVLLKEYVMKETSRAGFGGLDIQRTPMGTRITLVAERPGIVIGRRGSNIKQLTREVDERFDVENPQIEVEEVREPALNAQIMAEKLASALERGWHFRRAGHSTLRRIMGSGAKGALIKLSGKLTSQRHRTEKFMAGHIKYCGEPKDDFVDQGFSVAKLKQGVIGVTVWIMDPDAKLPDEIEVEAPETPVEPATPVAPAPEAPAGEGLKVTLAKRAPQGKRLGPAERKLKKLKQVAAELGEEVELDLEEPPEEAEVPEAPEGSEAEAPAPSKEKTAKAATKEAAEPEEPAPAEDAGAEAPSEGAEEE